MHITPLSLLDTVAVGKILFQHQPQLSTAALNMRVHRMRLQEELPMKKIGKNFFISYQKLQQWVQEKDL